MRRIITYDHWYDAASIFLIEVLIGFGLAALIMWIAEHFVPKHLVP